MRYLPYVLAVVALVGFTAYQGIVTDRWRENIEAKECAQLLESIPKNIGDWVGEDKVVADQIKNTAGAEGYVSRTYRNSKTNQVVDVWFIVGHSFDIWRHTPTVCYRVQQFEQHGKEEVYTIQAEGQEPADFFTTIFKKGASAERVFWGWSKPVRDEEQVNWIAPQGSKSWFAPSGGRGYFGNMRALYKLYFTAGVASPDEKPEDCVCVEFAQEFLPVANAILEQGVPSPGTEPVKPDASETETTTTETPAGA
jgi:hypothetical protein